MLFVDKSYSFHFLDLLGEMSERYGVEVHAYVLMGNHHLIVRTPEGNASAAMQWLNVSFGAWFNAKQQRVGHVFQGRFRSTLVDGDGGWLLKLSAYVHLNPVWVTAMGLGKWENKAEAQGLVQPDRQAVSARLMDYKTVSAQVRRLRTELRKSSNLRREEKACLQRLANVETTLPGRCA